MKPFQDWWAHLFPVLIETNGNKPNYLKISSLPDRVFQKMGHCGESSPLFGRITWLANSLKGPPKQGLSSTPQTLSALPPQGSLTLCPHWIPHFSTCQHCPLESLPETPHGSLLLLTEPHLHSSKVSPGGMVPPPTPILLTEPPTPLPDSGLRVHSFLSGNASPLLKRQWARHFSPNESFPPLGSHASSFILRMELFPHSMGIDGLCGPLPPLPACGPLWSIVLQAFICACCLAERQLAFSPWRKWTDSVKRHILLWGGGNNASLSVECGEAPNRLSEHPHQHHNLA